MSPEREQATVTLEQLRTEWSLTLDPAVMEEILAIEDAKSRMGRV